jgi:phosphatidylserine decarboxylase
MRGKRPLVDFLYKNSAGKALRKLFARGWVSRAYGRFMRSALSRRLIAPFVRRHKIDMSDFVRQVDEYASFNDFFIRHLRPGARPIAQGDDVLVAPADSTCSVYTIRSSSAISIKRPGFPIGVGNDIPPLCHPTLDVGSSQCEKTDVTPRNDGGSSHLKESFCFFPVKQCLVTLPGLLQDVELARSFAGGTALIFRLAPHHYHRFHFPCSGSLASLTPIKGGYESVDPAAYTATICPPLKNKRAVFRLTTSPVWKDPIMVAVGALLVGDIVSTAKIGAIHEKGDELGYFACGGSTVILLLRAGTVLLDDFLGCAVNTGKEVEVCMGSRIGTMSSPE